MTACGFERASFAQLFALDADGYGVMAAYFAPTPTLPRFAGEGDGLRLPIVLSVAVWFWRQGGCCCRVLWIEILPLAALGRHDSLELCSIS